MPPFTYTTVSSVPWSVDFANLSVCDQTGLVRTADFVANLSPLNAISFANIPNHFEEGSRITNTTTHVAIVNVGTVAIPNFVSLGADGGNFVESVTGFYVDNTNPSIPVVTVPKGNLTGSSVNPGATNDITQGYTIGSLWFNVLNSTLWICQVNTASSATWEEVLTGHGTFNSTGSVAPIAANDNTQGYSIGSLWYDNLNRILYVAHSVGTGTASWHAMFQGNGLNNITTTAPGAGNDNTVGYSIGSQWLNTTTQILYVATSVGTGTATWVAVNRILGAGYYTVTVLTTGATPVNVFAVAPIAMTITGVSAYGADATGAAITVSQTAGTVASLTSPASQACIGSAIANASVALGAALTVTGAAGGHESYVTITFQTI